MLWAATEGLQLKRRLWPYGVGGSSWVNYIDGRSSTKGIQITQTVCAPDSFDLIRGDIEIPRDTQLLNHMIERLEPADRFTEKVYSPSSMLWLR